MMRFVSYDSLYDLYDTILLYDLYDTILLYDYVEIKEIVYESVNLKVL